MSKTSHAQGPAKSRSVPKRAKTHRRTEWGLPIAAGGLVVLILGGVLLANRLAAPGADGGLAPITTLQTATHFHSLTLSPRDPNRIWVGTHDAIQESTDGGQTWRRLPTVSGDAMNLAQPIGNAGPIYMAGHEIFERSTDGGQTWQVLRTDLPDMDMHGFVADPTDAQHLYTYVVAHGLFTSTDGGPHWQPLPTQPGAIGNLALVPGTPSRLYVVTARGVARSADGGQTWQLANAGLPAEARAAWALLAVPGRPSELYVGTNQGLYRTRDAGASWPPAGLWGQPIVALAASSSGPLRVYVLTATGALFRLDGSAVQG